MIANKKDIRLWLEAAKVGGCTHVIVVCDTFDHDDYPVLVTPDEDVHVVCKKYHGVNMQRVMEVYSLTMDIEAQLAEHRAFHLG